MEWQLWRWRGIKLWTDAWKQFIAFLAFPPEIRQVIYTTNAIESLNARFRRATRIRGHFPSETAALKVLYLTIRERDERGGKRRRGGRQLEAGAQYIRDALRRSDHPCDID